jgi:hypothetical protein
VPSKLTPILMSCADQVQRHPGGKRLPQLGGHLGQYRGAGQQGFAAVQRHFDPRQVVFAYVLGNASGCLADDHRRHDLRAGLPGLVAWPVHVAVVASQVAPGVELEDELPEGHRLFR